MEFEKLKFDIFCTYTTGITVCTCIHAHSFHFKKYPEGGFGIYQGIVVSKQSGSQNQSGVLSHIYANAKSRPLLPSG